MPKLIMWPTFTMTPSIKFLSFLSSFELLEFSRPDLVYLKNYETNKIRLQGFRVFSLNEWLMLVACLVTWQWDFQHSSPQTIHLCHKRIKFAYQSFCSKYSVWFEVSVSGSTFSTFCCTKHSAKDGTCLPGSPYYREPLVPFSTCKWFLKILNMLVNWEM